MKKTEKIWVIRDGYLVNRDGSIYKLNWCRTKTMRKVKQSTNPLGYLEFGFNGKPVYSHRFIAECFLPNPKKLPEVNHKDENKANNCVDNLEWCTHKYNINHGTRNKRVSTSRKNKSCSKKVYQYTLDGKFVKEWNSINEIGKKLGYNISIICMCCKGKCKQAYNSVWLDHKL